MQQITKNNNVNGTKIKGNKNQKLNGFKKNGIGKLLNLVKNDPDWNDAYKQARFDIARHFGASENRF